MRTALYVVAFLVGAMGWLSLRAFRRTKQLGMLAAAVVYLAGSIAAASLEKWWPLAVALAVAWGLRLLGLDPGRK
jgi:hypothetical protein